ncbi:restriction endonuclease subunit S [Avibacterium paragallinarum]|uniref:restriction endonuclease subunit S n=1 Tax=Avibacterium paragallinarum TaxID=728 RepID=UPI0039871D08
MNLKTSSHLSKHLNGFFTAQNPYAWEKCKLGDVIKFINGKAYKQEELLDSGKYRVVRVGNFNTNEHWYYSDLELESDKYMTKGDLLYLWATDFGPRFWNGEKAIFHYHIWRLEVDYKILNKNYLYTWLETDKEKIKQSTNGTTMVHVTKSTMEKRLFLYPTLLEQQKIGNLFKQLDRLITLHKRKLLEKYNKNNTKFLQNVTHQQSVLKLCCITFNPIIERTSLCN